MCVGARITICVFSLIATASGVTILISNHLQRFRITSEGGESGFMFQNMCARPTFIVQRLRCITYPLSILRQFVHKFQLFDGNVFEMSLSGGFRRTRDIHLTCSQNFTVMFWSYHHTPLCSYANHVYLFILLLLGTRTQPK